MITPHQTATQNGLRYHSDVPSYFFWKGPIDRILALALVVPGVLLIGGLIILIRLSSKGPAIYSQKRVGKGGILYTMYKLRSMRIDAEDGTGPVWCANAKDNRITPLGYWLRRLHLDELPQLLNVLRGEMSLIGPRPERPEFVRVLAESIPDYTERLRVAPGVTGLAQINLPPDTDLDSVRRKLVLDLEYIRTATLLLDFRMILCTFLRMIGLKGEFATRTLALGRKVELPSSDTDPMETNLATEVTPDAIAATVAVELLSNPRPSRVQRNPLDSIDPEDSGILEHSSRI